MQPLFVEADLLHVNIVRRHCLVAASDPLVLREEHTMLRDQQRKWRHLWCVFALVCQPEANDSTPFSFFETEPVHFQAPSKLFEILIKLSRT